MQFPAWRLQQTYCINKHKVRLIRINWILWYKKFQILLGIAWRNFRKIGTTFIKFWLWVISFNNFSSTGGRHRQKYREYVKRNRVVRSGLLSHSKSVRSWPQTPRRILYSNLRWHFMLLSVWGSFICNVKMYNSFVFETNHLFFLYFISQYRKLFLISTYKRMLGWFICY